MNIQQEVCYPYSNRKWRTIFKKGEIDKADLVLAFGNRKILAENAIYEQLNDKYPNSHIVTCSTSGEILGADVLDQTISITAVEFRHVQLKVTRTNIVECKNSFEAGLEIVRNLCQPDLKHVFVISDGQMINGSSLVEGLNNFKCRNVGITGGLAGDGYDFTRTLVGLNSAPKEGEIVAIGFYGNRLKVGYGSNGGWDAFGPERIVTRSKENILYELDGISALSLYKEYLGEASNQLPSSALYFPLSIVTKDHQQPLVRTILSLNEEEQSMTFAGNVPEGAVARLMKHNPDKLIDGAEQAAKHSFVNLGQTDQPELAILVSCVGRKIVLGQKIEEEVEVIRDLLGNQTAITGFYSYGEIAPQQYHSNPELHNQTMTITTFSEI